MMKTAAIAAVLERDLLRSDTSPSHNIVACFACGFTFVYRGRQGERNGRFCSMRCQDWYDAGNPSYEQQQEHDRLLAKAVSGFVVAAGPPGLEVGAKYWPFGVHKPWDGRCAHCRKEFNSNGLRCCSFECERSYRERQDNLAVMAEAGIEPSAPKRLCPECGVRIPVWRKGRKVSSKTLFCSPRCADKHRKAA